jgi:hypothetical protein
MIKEIDDVPAPKEVLCRRVNFFWWHFGNLIETAVFGKTFVSHDLAAVQALRARMAPGDEIWRFYSRQSPLMMRSGYALVRQGSVVASVTVAVS